MENTNAQVTEQQSEVTHTFTDAELQALLENNQKEKYEIGKKSGIEMTLKSLKQNYSKKLNTDLNSISDFDSLIETVANTKLSGLQNEFENLKSQLSTEQKTLLEKYEAEKKSLQNLLTEKETELTNKLTEREQEILTIKKDMLLQREIDSLQIDVPQNIVAQGEEAVSKYLALEKQKAFILLNNLLKINFNSNNEIEVADLNNQIYKDRLQNPKKLNEVVKQLATDYNLITKQQAVATKLAGSKGVNALYSNMTEEQFKQKMIEEGINPRSNEYAKRFGDFKQNKV